MSKCSDVNDSQANVGFMTNKITTYDDISQWTLEITGVGKGVRFIGVVHSH